MIVELEKFADEKAKQTVDVPMVKAADVGRQQGFVVVQVTDSLRAEALENQRTVAGRCRRTARRSPLGPLGVLVSLCLGPLRVDARRREGAAADHRRFAGRSVAAARPADARSDGDLHDREGRRLPAGIGRSGRLRRAARSAGTNVAGAAPVAVDSHYLEGAKKTRLVVNLSRKAIGRVALAVQLQKDLHQPELLTPTGKTPQIALAASAGRPATAERATGRLMISAPESLQITPEKTVGLRGISFKEAYRRGEGAVARFAERAETGWAYAFNGEEPVDLTFTAERRKPQVTIAQLMVVRVEEGVVKYDFTSTTTSSTAA